MEINNWFDFIIYTVYFFGVALIILPTGILFLWLTIRKLIKMKPPKYEERHYKYFSARNVFEVCLAGVFSVIFSVWYLFFAKGGNLFLYPTEVMKFFTGA